MRKLKNIFIMNNIIAYVAAGLGIFIIIMTTLHSQALNKDAADGTGEVGSVFLHNESDTPRVGYFQLGAKGLDKYYAQSFEHSVKDKLGRAVRTKAFGERDSKFYGIKTTFFQTAYYLVEDDTYYRLTARSSEEEGVFYVEHKYSFDEERSCSSVVRELKSSIKQEYGIKNFRSANSFVELNTGMLYQVSSKIDDVYMAVMGWNCNDEKRYKEANNVIYVRIGMPPSVYAQRDRESALITTKKTILAHKQ